MGCLKLTYQENGDANFFCGLWKKSATEKNCDNYYAWGDVVREQKTNELDIYRYAYQGQYSEKDEETGWEHFELREYDPVIGRWLIPDPYGQYWSPYMAMGNNPVNTVDPRGGEGEDECPECAGQGIMLKTVTVTPSSWQNISDSFDKLLDNISLAFDNKLGVRFWGSGTDPNVFAGSNPSGKKIIDINVKEMQDAFGLHKEWNPPGGSRYDASKMKNVNPKQIIWTVENMKKSMESANAFSNELIEYMEAVHKAKSPFVRKLVYDNGPDDFALDTMESYTNETAKKAMLAPVISVDAKDRSYYRTMGERQKKKK